MSAHPSESPGHEPTAPHIDETLRMIAANTTATPPVGLHSAIMDGLREEWAGEESRPHRRPWRVVVAIGMAAAAASVAFLPLPRVPPQHRSRTIEQTAIATPTLPIAAFRMEATIPELKPPLALTRTLRGFESTLESPLRAGGVLSFTVPALRLPTEPPWRTATNSDTNGDDARG